MNAEEIDLLQRFVASLKVWEQLTMSANMGAVQIRGTLRQLEETTALTKEVMEKTTSKEVKERCRILLREGAELEAIMKNTSLH